MLQSRKSVWLPKTNCLIFQVTNDLIEKWAWHGKNGRCFTHKTPKSTVLEHNRILKPLFGLETCSVENRPILYNSCLITVYVDASEECNTLSFQLGPSQASREWAIRVTQYACDYENLAPKGCLQYFFATSGTGNLETFNRANKIHLAGQDQNMCIRRESGNCRICYSTAAMDFKISKTATALLGKSVSSKTFRVHSGRNS